MSYPLFCSVPHPDPHLYSNYPRTDKENSMSQLVRVSGGSSSSSSSAEGKPWVCSLCSKRFAMKRGLTVHVDTIHENSKRFECHLCSRVFNQKGNLNNHIRVSHEGSKDYMCELCEWKFSAVALLDKHMISVHKVEPHFDCDICGQIYDNRKLLRKHKVSFHKDTSGNRMHEVRKRFFCGFCSVGFSFKTFLDKHIGSVHSGKHSGHVCKVCDKAFEDKASLESHTATKHKQIHLQQQETHKQQGISIPQQQILLTIPETSTTQILQTNEASEGDHQQVHIQTQQQQQQQQQLFYQPYNAQAQQQQQQQILNGQQGVFANASNTITLSNGEVATSGAGAIQPLQLHHFQYQPPLGTTAQPTLLYQPATTQQPHQIQIHLQPLTSLMNAGSSSPPPAHQTPPVLPSGATITPATPQPAHASLRQYSGPSSSLTITATIPGSNASPPSTISKSALQSLQAPIQQGLEPVQLMIQQQDHPAAEACDICNLPCSDKQDLIKHKALFHNFKCEICEDKFPSFETLTIHKISHLTPCPVCEVRFKETSQLLQHFIEVHEGQELCNICYQEVFESKEALAAHMEERHGPESKIKCEEALKTVKNEVKEHKKFVSVVDELVVQLQKYKDKTSHRKRKSKEAGGELGRAGSKAPHLGNGNNGGSSGFQFS